MNKILVADDDIDICTLLKKFLNKNGYDVAAVHSGRKLIAALKEDKFDLLLCDFRLGDMDGLQIMSEVNALSADMPVIIITGYSDIKTAVNVIKAGAVDYITKPLYPEEILLTVKKAFEAPLNGSANQQAPLSVRKREIGGANKKFKFVVGQSNEAKEMYKQIDLVAPTNYSVIVYGESGAGKEAVAQAIHERSLRSDRPFVAMDCGAISKELAGSELFGHEKGSFTGAINFKIGHFEMANGGTLFLDEVSNLSYEVQTALLRVVQERKVKRIGGVKEIDLDVRIIVASNENLTEAFRKGKFREDLYHRFNEFTLHVPPLRNRNTDILYFADHFLVYANQELNKSIKGFSDDVKEIFMNYSWPGNLREMKNVIKRSALLTNGGIIESKALPFEIVHNVDFRVSEDKIEKPKSEGSYSNLKDAALEAEYETILNVLKQVKFNKTKAAKLLNIDRKTLYNKMRHFNL
jgi:two-component system, NtrC family, response regulator HydG